MKAEKLKPCSLCGQGVMHSGLPIFWRLSVERMAIDRKAVQQVAGLETMLGSVHLARVMGPDPDIAKPIGPAVELMICEPCASQETSIYEIAMQDEPSDDE